MYGRAAYVWNISLMYGILALCFGKESKSHVTQVQLWRSVLSYNWDICLMSGILVLCLGDQSYVWDTSLMFGILVLCLGYQSYVWNINLMSGILVLCLGYQSYVWRIRSQYSQYLVLRSCIRSQYLGLTKQACLNGHCLHAHIIIIYRAAFLCVRVRTQMHTIKHM